MKCLAVQRAISEPPGGGEIEHAAQVMGKYFKTRAGFHSRLAQERAMNAAWILSPEKKRAVRKILRNMSFAAGATDGQRARNEKYAGLLYGEVGLFRGWIFFSRFSKADGKAQPFPEGPLIHFLACALNFSFASSLCGPSGCSTTPSFSSSASSRACNCFISETRASLTRFMWS